MFAVWIGKMDGAEGLGTTQERICVQKGGREQTHTLSFYFSLALSLADPLPRTPFKEDGERRREREREMGR